jgi:hypothetical protein
MFLTWQLAANLAANFAAAPPDETAEFPEAEVRPSARYKHHILPDTSGSFVPPTHQTQPTTGGLRINPHICPKSSAPLLFPPLRFRRRPSSCARLQAPLLPPPPPPPPPPETAPAAAAAPTADPTAGRVSMGVGVSPADLALLERPAAISDGLAARGVCERQRHFVNSPIVGQLEWDGREGVLPPLSVLRRHEMAPLPFTQRWAIHWIKYAHRHGWQPLLDTRTVKAEVTCMGCCRVR